MPFGGSSIPTPKSVPEPTYQETVKQNDELQTKRQLSLERAMLAQNQLGAQQTKAGGAGLKV